jgi:hypothetical protein
MERRESHSLIHTERSPAMSQENAAKDEAAKAEPKPVKAKAEAKGAIVTKSPSLSIWDRPVMPSEMEMFGTLQMAGERPVTVSHMEIFGTILNGRPIEASGMKVYEMMPGGRPIFLSDFHAVEGLDLPGGRPVMASAAGLLDSGRLTGDRPIYTNDTDNPSELMGFID